MLNQNRLENEIKGALQEYLPLAFEEAMKVMMPTQTENGKEMCERFGKTVSEILSEPLASSLAAAIDYYVKNISISGTIITAGSPATQTAIIKSPSPITNGVVPNSLKIS